MNESTAEMHGNHGYLCSKAIERDKVITSWREEQEAEYQQAFERLKTEKTKILYETRNHLGVRGERVDESTGEIYSVTLRDEKLTNALKNAGMKIWTRFIRICPQRQTSPTISLHCRQLPRSPRNSKEMPPQKAKSR